MKVLAVHPGPLMYTKIYLRLEPLGLPLQPLGLAGPERRVMPPDEPGRGLRRRGRGLRRRLDERGRRGGVARRRGRRGREQAGGGQQNRDTRRPNHGAPPYKAAATPTAARNAAKSSVAAHTGHTRPRLTAHPSQPCRRARPPGTRLRYPDVARWPSG